MTKTKTKASAKKRRTLFDLSGALPATRPFPGKEAAREEVGKALGQRHKRGFS
jgi:hypothetical protein